MQKGTWLNPPLRTLSSRLLARKAVSPMGTPVPPKAGCLCCMAWREIVWSAALFAVGCLLLFLIDKAENGNTTLKALGLKDVRPLLKWPVVIWMALLVFAVLTHATKCLKIPIEKLLGIDGASPKPTGSEGGISGSGIRLPPLSPGIPMGSLVPAAVSAAVAIAVTLRVHPTVDQPDPLDLPVQLKVAPVNGNAAVAIPVALAASEALKLPVSVSFTPAELKQPIELSTTGKTEVILKPDADVRELVKNLVTAAEALGKSSSSQSDDLARLVQATTELRDASSSMLVWSAKAEQNLGAYGVALHNAVSQLNGLTVDVNFLRNAVLPAVQTEFPPRWRECATGPGTLTGLSPSDCANVQRIFDDVTVLRQGMGFGTSGGLTRTSSRAGGQSSGR